MDSLCAGSAVDGIFLIAVISVAVEVEAAPHDDRENRDCCGVNPDVVLATTENRAPINFSERTMLIVLYMLKIA